MHREGILFKTSTNKLTWRKSVGLESIDRFVMYLTTRCYRFDYVAVDGSRQEEYCSRFGSNVLRSDRGLF
jgi:hypothetical protein